MVFLNAISVYLLLAAVCSVFWAVRVRTLNGSGYSYVLLLLSFAMCFYILGYVMELNSDSPAQIVFWNHIEFLGIPFVSALWLTTALMYTGHFVHNKMLLIAVIFAIPLVTLILRFTNDYHHLYFASMEYLESYGTIFIIKHAGPWWYVQLTHSLLAILIAMGLFMGDAIKNEERQKGKVYFTIGASAIAIAGLLLAAIKPGGLPLDYMVLCLPLAIVAIVFAITRYDFLETKSIARNRVFDASEHAILLINRRYKILDYNNSARELFAQIDIRLSNGYLSSLLEETSDLYNVLKSTDPSVVMLQTDTGERYYNITTTTIDEDRAFRGWIKTLSDITETHNLNEELRKQALTDELSMLSNRRAFIRIGRTWVSRADKDGKPLYLLMLDLDYFKKINDQYGHLAGDLVIRQFSEIMRQVFLSECLIARLGGEEFAILHRGLGETEMQQMANTFLQKTQQKVYRYQTYRFRVTVSIGMTKKQPDQTLESMMGKADQALYESKDQGRNRLAIL